MNRFWPRQGTKAPYWRHHRFIADSMDLALRGALADYIGMAQDFFVHGAEISTSVSGTSTTYTITAGHVVYKGEIMPVDAHAVTKSSSQVVYITVQDDGVDVTPTVNMDGNSDYVLRRRHAKLRVGPAYPTEHMVISAPRKSELDALRFKGRLVLPGAIMPYYGSMANFNAAGLGIVGSPVDGWAVCNGLNGTPDMRGMVPVGATNVPSSGAPALYAGVTASDVGDAAGSDRVTLEADQLPAHTHGYTSQAITYDGGGPIGAGGDGTRHTAGGTTAANVTAGDDVDVRQSSMALVYIMSLA